MLSSLELGQVSPGEGFTKMEMGKGLPEGVHTGGPWLSPDGKDVWKPLDAKPYPNATERYPTDEAECLEAMAGKPGFPRNWRVEERRGRRWLVRSLCWPWPQEDQIQSGLDIVLLIEQAVYDLNAAGWEAFGSDLPQAALDPDGDWFILDLSAAHHVASWRTGWHGDRERVIRWMDAVGRGWLADLRRRGQGVYHNVALSHVFEHSEGEPYRAGDVFYKVPKEARKGYCYIYASRNRSMSTLWARIEGAKFLDADMSLSPVVHTWVAADHMLDEETVKRYELTLAYRPWP